MNQQSIAASGRLGSVAAGVPAGVDLGVYAAHIQELVLYLRDEGHLLSSIDQYIIESWWEAGYPLEVVLQTVHARGLRLKQRKKPPRGLPLRSLNRYVEKAGADALAQSVGTHDRGGPAQAAAAGADGAERGQRLVLLLAGIEVDISDAAALRDADDPSQPLLAELLDGVAALASSPESEVAVFNSLLVMGRRYYEALWDACSLAQREELRIGVLDSLGEAAAQMTGEAFEQTVAELCRRRLRTRDPLLDPDRYWMTN